MLTELKVPSNLFQILTTLIDLNELRCGDVTIDLLCFYLDRSASTVHSLLADLKQRGWLIIESAASRTKGMVYKLRLDLIESRGDMPTRLCKKTQPPKAKKNGPVVGVQPLAADNVSKNVNQENPSPGSVDPGDQPVANCSSELGLRRFGLFPSLLDLAPPKGATLALPANPTPENYRPWLYPKAVLPWLAHYGLDHLCVEVKRSRVTWQPHVIDGCIAVMGSWSNNRSTSVQRGDAIPHLTRRLNQLAGLTSITNNEPFSEAIAFLELCEAKGQELKRQAPIDPKDGLDDHQREIVEDFHRLRAEGSPIPATWKTILVRAGLMTQQGEILESSKVGVAA